MDTKRLKELTDDAQQIGEAMGILKSNPSFIHLQRAGCVLMYSNGGISSKYDLPFSNKIPGLHDAIRSLIEQQYQHAMDNIAKDISSLCQQSNDPAISPEYEDRLARLIG